MKVNTTNLWLWVFIILLDLVIGVYYYNTYTELIEQEFESRRIWVPMDLILTFFVFIYQIIYLVQEIYDNDHHLHE
jgi:hypothetical protein